ncbi:hypothetical protein [Salibacterium halotolerans]|uniref:Uncharacterized protein n=1 Tax=Salibacterium halotolerans TaxID=1884432 RepID=A0A1I5UV65_9BACI|nr:hypothetical protein [Salibacterium halotolerans]SFP99078.1 hypothetical protein SAMN05518683_11467 [Salibacterium halotolerans]
MTDEQIFDLLREVHAELDNVNDVITGRADKSTLQTLRGKAAKLRTVNDPDAVEFGRLLVKTINAAEKMTRTKSKRKRDEEASKVDRNSIAASSAFQRYMDRRITEVSGHGI